MSQTDPPLPFRADQIGGGLQPERTTLAWERTAIAMTVAGVVLARHGAVDLHPSIGLIGVAQAVAGGVLLAWALRHHHDIDQPDGPGAVRPQVGMTRLVGLVTVAVTSTALVVGLASLAW